VIDACLFSRGVRSTSGHTTLCECECLDWKGRGVKCEMGGGSQRQLLISFIGLVGRERYAVAYFLI